MTLGLTARPRDKYWRAFNRNPLTDNPNASPSPRKIWFTKLRDILSHHDRQDTPAQLQGTVEQDQQQGEGQQQEEGQQEEEQLDEEQLDEEQQREPETELSPTDILHIGLEVHWTVRLLNSRYNNRAECLPGYQMRQPPPPADPPNDAPEDTERQSRYSWIERNKLGDAPDPAWEEGFYLQERGPSEEEIELYEAWFDSDGQLYDGRRYKTQKRDHEWLNVLSGFTEKADVKVSKKHVRNETIREWFLSQRQHFY